MTFYRNRREAVTRTQDMLLKQPLELVIEGADQPIGLSGCFYKFCGNGIAGKPKFYFTIINTIAAAPDVGVGMLRVAPGAHIRQVERGSRLIIANKNGHDGPEKGEARLPGNSRAKGERMTLERQVVVQLFLDRHRLHRLADLLSASTSLWRLDLRH